MQNSLLKPLIERIKNQDMTAFPLVFDEFKKLITFYGTKLKYEDAASDLTLFFIELLYEINIAKFPSNDGEDIHRYIATSIKNRFISLSVVRANICKQENSFIEECYGCSECFDDRFWFSQGISRLNDAQQMVIIHHFVYGYSIAEIATRLNISRQAVNKTKNQALEILREALINDENFFV